jgi:hypothetical protein
MCGPLHPLHPLHTARSYRSRRMEDGGCDTRVISGPRGTNIQMSQIVIFALVRLDAVLVTFPWRGGGFQSLNNMNAQGT